MKRKSNVNMKNKVIATDKKKCYSKHKKRIRVKSVVTHDRVLAPKVTKIRTV